MEALDARLTVGVVEGTREVVAAELEDAQALSLAHAELEALPDGKPEAEADCDGAFERVVDDDAAGDELVVAHAVGHADGTDVAEGECVGDGVGTMLRLVKALLELTSDADEESVPMEERLPAAVGLPALDTLAHGDTLSLALACDDADAVTVTAPEAEFERDVEVERVPVGEKLTDAVTEGDRVAETDDDCDFCGVGDTPLLALARRVVDTDTDAVNEGELLSVAVDNAVNVAIAVDVSVAYCVGVDKEVIESMEEGVGTDDAEVQRVMTPDEVIREETLVVTLVSRDSDGEAVVETLLLPLPVCEGDPLIDAH